MPDRTAFTFLRDGQQDEQHLTYGALELRARAVADALAERASAGARVMVVLKPGIDYVVALLGSLYGGFVPAPVYPPDPFRLARTLPRLQAVFANAQCELLLTAGDLLGGAGSLLRADWARGVVDIQALPAARVDSGHARPKPDDLALLQYTSGTTGEPRGVALTHRQILENLRGMRRVLDVPDAIALQWLPPYHDLGLIGGVFLPLYAGRRSVLMSPLSFMQRPARWLRAISRLGATTSAAPNFGYELCLRKVTDEDCRGLDLSRWRVAVSGAEPVRAATLRRFAERFAPHGFRPEAFVPAYGMAETTLMVSVAPHDRQPTVLELDQRELAAGRVAPAAGGRQVVGCGPPGPGIEVRVVDPQTTKPTDGVGEIWVRGASVATGYWRQPEATATRFQQSIDGEGGGFFRTGDLGFVRGGELFLVGRRKELIILAGRNFYPHDLEQAVQSASPAFKADAGAAVAVADGQRPGEGERMAYFQEVHRPKKQDLAELLRTARRALLEETGAEPARVVLLPVGDLPKTSSGKIRRSDCWGLYRRGELSPLASWPDDEAAAPARGQAAGAPHPPSTATERWLADCWRDVLGVDRIDRGDDFFRLGARSLQITEVLSRVAAHTGVMAPLRVLLDNPTLAGLAAEVDRRAAESPPQPEQQAPPIAPAAAGQPLSPAQSRFWLIDQVGVPGSANVPIVLELSGPIEADRLGRAVQTLVARHDALRLAFSGAASTVEQRVVPVAEARLPPVASLHTTGAGGGPAWLDRLLDDPWVWRPFDMSRPPLLRAGYATAAGRHAVVLVAHHAVCDGASLRVLANELAGLCRAASLPPPPPLPAARPLPATRAEALAGYWRARLRDEPASLGLPLRPLGSEQSASHTTTAVGVEPALPRQAAAAAAASGVTPFAWLLAAWQLVLSRYTGQSRVGVGVAVAEGAGGRPAVGCRINTLPIFAHVGAQPREPFAGFARRVTQTLFASLDHGELPWEDIVGAAGKPRDAGRMPVVQAFFLHEELSATGLKLNRSGEPPVEVIDVGTDYRGLGVFDLSLVADFAGSVPRLKLVHDSNRWPQPLAERMLLAYRGVATATATQPQTPLDRLPVPAAEERQRLAAGEMPAAAVTSPGRQTAADLPARVAEQSRRRPQACAIQCDGRRLTYAELDGLVGRLAAGLAERGVRRGDRVGLLLGRSPQMPAAILACWRLGAAYVPLDPGYPTARLSMMAQDAGLSLLVTDQGDAAERSGLADPVAIEQLLQAAGHTPADDPAVRRRGGRLAYLMYTSGSTGRPKGVRVTHLGVDNLVGSFARDTGVGPGDAVFAATTFAFDISVLELLLPLSTGAELVLADDRAAGDATRMATLLGDTPVTLLQGAPATFQALLAAGWRPRPDQTVLCGGEELPPALAARLVSSRRLWNVYGPTETTIWSTRHEVQPTDLGGPIPLGKPIAGTRCYVLDAAGRLAPVGVWGELVIAGLGVADGYHNLPEETAARFQADPFLGEAGDRSTARQPPRWYRTGDTARWAPARRPAAAPRVPGEQDEWVLEYGGRRDSQIKLHGRRIELREVELALATHPAIAEAVVAVRGDGERAALTAFVIPADGQQWAPDILREHLAEQLPCYMIPSRFVAVSHFPRTANGKLDRAGLPGPADQAGPDREAYGATPPRTPLERTLAGWACELLRVEHLGVHDNFFEHGGQSLMATQIVIRMRDELGCEPPLRDVYRRPTIAAWAELILQTELAKRDATPGDLLTQIESMSDSEAAEYLHGMADG